MRKKKISINTDSKQMQKTSVHVSNSVCGLSNQLIPHASPLSTLSLLQAPCD